LAPRGGPARLEVQGGGVSGAPSAVVEDAPAKIDGTSAKERDQFGAMQTASERAGRAFGQHLARAEQIAERSAPRSAAGRAGSREGAGINPKRNECLLPSRWPRQSCRGWVRNRGRCGDHLRGVPASTPRMAPSESGLSAFSISGVAALAHPHPPIEDQFGKQPIALK
jgi:hypothetical protein